MNSNERKVKWELVAIMLVITMALALCMRFL